MSSNPTSAVKGLGNQPGKGERDYAKYVAVLQQMNAQLGVLGVQWK